MHPNIERVLIDEVTLKKRIAEMAEEISRDYAGQELLVIGLLKGAAYFMVELTGIGPATSSLRTRRSPN